MIDIKKIAATVESEWGMGGLQDGLYGDFAEEVAKRAIAEERERYAKLCEASEVVEYDDPGGFFARLIRA